MAARARKNSTRTVDLTVPKSLQPRLPRRKGAPLPVEFVAQVKVKYYAPVLASVNLMKGLLRSAQTDPRAFRDAEWHATGLQVAADIRGACQALRGLPPPEPQPESYIRLVKHAEQLEKLVILFQEFMDGGEKSKLGLVNAALAQDQAAMESADMSFLRSKPTKRKIAKSSRPLAKTVQRRRA
ncbi:MAG: hypothetical protein HY782_16195 [Chloroflexi bacterium]|nr:hypothetical protein [Chloroflexota bacterium]